MAITYVVGITLQYLPFGAFWMLHPAGKPSASPSRLFWELLLLVDVETVDSRLEELFDKLSI